ncbi:MAG: hypothetical protein AB1716_00815 [Planctomycetota bacterium]
MAESERLRGFTYSAMITAGMNGCDQRPADQVWPCYVCMTAIARQVCEIE